MKISQKRSQNVRIIIILLVLCALTIAQEPSPQKQSNPLVKLSLIVADRSNHSLDDVKKDEIQIFEDKIPQTVSLFAKDERPVDYGVAIDSSGSLRTLFGAVIGAAKLIVSNNRDGDEVFLERFISADKIETIQEFTSDKARLIKGLDSLYIEGGQSAVVDGVYLAVKHVAEHRPDPNRRRALVLLTDGEDRQSYYTDSQLLQLIRGQDAQVFVIGIVAQLDDRPRNVGRSPREKAEKLMRALAQETSGRVFFPKNTNELGQAVAEIVHDLHGQYMIGYQSTGNDSKDNFRTVEVKISEAPGREKLTAVTRPGYFLNPPTVSSEETDKKKKPKTKT